MKKRYIFWWILSALFFWNAMARFASLEDTDIGLVFLVIAGILFYRGYLRAKEYEQQQEDRAALHRLVSLVAEKEARQPSDSVCETSENHPKPAGFVSMDPQKDTRQSSISVRDFSGFDATLEDCVDLALDRQSISVRDIERELRVGYSRAARWVDEMESLGIVGPYQGEKPRDVLYTRDTWPGLKKIREKPLPDLGGNKDHFSEKSSAFQKTLESIPQVDIEVSETGEAPKASASMPDIHFYNVTRRTNLDKLFPLVVIDTETTGLKPRSNEIIEISAIRYESGFKPVSCFSTLLRSRNPIPPQASTVNNITDDMVKDKPYFSQIADAFSEYISGCTIVGHNLGFDLKFLNHAGAQLPDKVKYIDTLDLAKHTLTSRRSKRWDSDFEDSSDDFDYDVEDYKLGTLCFYYGIVPHNAHRSLSDCLATGMVLECLIEDKTK